MSCCGKKPSKKRRSKFRHIKPNALIKELAINKGPAHKTFLMCRPTFYAVYYSINPWMDLRVQVNNSKSIEQWHNLHDRIKEHGGDVRYIAPQPGLPDMVFTANAATVFKEKHAVIISNFKYPERKGEEEWFVKWFAEDGWFHAYPSASYEGAGDALMLNGSLVCGTGFRSEQQAHTEIEQFWRGPVLVVKMVDPYFYHLDTCFCPLEDGDYLIYPAAFDKDSFQAIEMLQREAPGSHGMVVPTDEAKRFACNAVCINKTVIMPEGCPTTTQILEQRGYKTVPVDMSEFIKAGGACKCLTLEI